MNQSYWEREYKTTYNYAIIGGGIIGLTTAINVKKLAPKARVLVLEQGQTTNASTKNAGFTCYSSLSELVDKYDNSDDEIAYHMMAKRVEGIKELFKLIKPFDCNYKQTGNYDLLDENNINVLDRMGEINKIIPQYTSDFKNTFSVVKKDFSFTNKVKALVYNQYEGELNTAKLYRALLDVALSLGVEIRFGTKVLGIDNEIHTDTFSFKYDHVAVCANALIPTLLNEYSDRIKPARAQVLITKPFAWNLDCPTHYQQGYFYFRYIDGRLLIGGGRNKDFFCETTTHLGNTDKIINEIKYVIKNIIGKDLEIDYSWSGLMATSNTLRPIIEVVPNRNNVVIGFACGGMGLALGAWAGKQVAELLIK